MDEKLEQLLIEKGWEPMTGSDPVGYFCFPESLLQVALSPWGGIYVLTVDLPSSQSRQLISKEEAHRIVEQIIPGEKWA